jgi:VIT1/CCC1 family predicted Fe2+/Mn2+ transporter
MSIEGKTEKRWLDPVERSMEALFGLIMVLTFTGSLSVMDAGRTEVREMLIGALGCNLAWGVIDACFYLMGILAERGRGIQRMRTLRASNDPAVLHRVLEEALPGVVVDVLSPAEEGALRDRLAKVPVPPRSARLNGTDLKGALGVFLWVFLVTFPVALPFLFIQDPFIALRVSNAIAILLLGSIGWRLANYAGFRKGWTVVLMVLFGMAMVGITIALGG